MPWSTSPASPFNRLKQYYKQHNNQKDNPPFTVKGMRKTLSMSPVTMSRHIKTLEDYGMVTCTGGNKRIGFEYQIVEWEDTYTKHEEYTKLVTALKRKAMKNKT